MPTRDAIAERIPTTIYWHDGVWWVPSYRSTKLYVSPRGDTLSRVHLVRMHAPSETAMLWPRGRE
jgi:hypothetical protein